VCVARPTSRSRRSCPAFGTATLWSREIKAPGKGYNGYVERVLKGVQMSKKPQSARPSRVRGETLLAAATPRVPAVPWSTAGGLESAQKREFGIA